MHKLGELLAKEKIISSDAWNQAKHYAETSGKNPIFYLIERKQISETQLLSFLSTKFSIPTVNIGKFEIRPEVLRLIPGELAKKMEILPIQHRSGVIVVALYDPTIIPQLDQVKVMTRCSVEAVLTSPRALQTAFSKYYSGLSLAEGAIRQFHQESSSNSEGISIELVEQYDVEPSTGAQDAPVIQFVNGIFAESVRRGASDIHIEPFERRVRIRYRVDGSLVEVSEVPPQMKRAIIARIKIMSRMDIAESRVPQDGRIKIRAQGKEIDFRVNSLPTLFGEKIVLRLLNKGNLQLDLTRLGFEQEQLDEFRKSIHQPNGMVLVTGPTGSGKTTTLYSALMELNQTSDNISTIEDPVEYNLEGINQVQINKDVGLSFALALRSLLRQDPDTILVGEIRDSETVEVAIQSALTGHLVLSTLHTNDAPSTIHRLINMGAEPFLVASAVNAIVAQRLLRKICSRCVETATVSESRLDQLPRAHRKLLDNASLRRGKGCRECNQTGYRGRIAIYEVLDIHQGIKEAIHGGKSVQEFKALAVEGGMQSLRESALKKAAAGMTTLEEALRMTTDHA